MSDTDLLDLLASGGDDRLVLDAKTGLNRYGHGTAPRPFDIAMGSSTASTISVPAFAAVQVYHAHLMRDLRSGNEAAVYQVGIETIRTRIRAALGGEAAVSGIDILISPSGTDSHLLAAALLKREGHSLLTITLEGSETGSSVGTAASGRHFMRHLPSGAQVMQGTPLDEAHASSIANVMLAVRDAAGALRDDLDIEQEIDAQIATALESGGDCLLVVADVTKTGLIAPGLESVFRLKARYGERLTIMVDACQLRISPATIRAYLERDLLVAITGSKFLGGPVFSGALLCPSHLARRLSDRGLPRDMGDYIAAADVPHSWAMHRALPKRANIGLLLRWHAALFEWERLQAIPADDVARVTSAFARTVEGRLRRDGAFEPIASRMLDRRALRLRASDIRAYDSVPTIFPFVLTRQDAVGRRIGLMNADETLAIYQRLAKGEAGRRAVRLGQPVACGTRLGTTVSALRLSLSAGLIADACESRAAQETLLANAIHALDMAALAARTAAVSSLSRAA